MQQVTYRQATIEDAESMTRLLAAILAGTAHL